ncbi:MAG: hypothetical protein ACRDTA_03160 [Pseudonocardiaceae bacterium]
MYSVITDEQTDQQIAALPAEVLGSFAEARTLLEIHPWSGDPIHRGNPEGPVRTLAFGHAGMIIYLIMEELRRVDLLEVLWAG